MIVSAHPDSHFVFHVLIAVAHQTVCVWALVRYDSAARHDDRPGRRSGAEQALPTRGIPLIDSYGG